MIGEREFYSKYVRVLRDMYKDASGTPRLVAKDLIDVQHVGIPTSAGKTWLKRRFDRAMIIGTPDSREIWYVPTNDPGDISADAVKKVYKSTAGFVQTWNPGDFYFCTPVLAGDTEGGKVDCLIFDGSQGTDTPIPPNQVVGGAASAQAFNVEEIGGESQTPVDLGALLKPVTWGAVTPFAVTNADQVLLAANGGRRGLSLYNEDAALTAWIDTAAAAATARGLYVVPPKTQILVGPFDFPPTVALHIRSTGSMTLSVKEGT